MNIVNFNKPITDMNDVKCRCPGISNAAHPSGKEIGRRHISRRRPPATGGLAARPGGRSLIRQRTPSFLRQAGEFIAYRACSLSVSSLSMIS